MNIRESTSLFTACSLGWLRSPLRMLVQDTRINRENRQAQYSVRPH